MADLQGTAGGWTGEESAGCHAEAHAGDLSRILAWLAEVVVHPILSSSAMARESRVIFEEGWYRGPWAHRRLAALGLDYDLSGGVREALFPDAGLDRPIIGLNPDLGRFRRADLLAFHRRHYRSDNAVLCVVGDVNPEGVFALAQARFGGLAPGGRPAPPPESALPKGAPLEVRVRGPWLQDHVTITVAARTVGHCHADCAALAVLREHLRRVLRAELRFERGLAYCLSVNHETYADAGYFAVTAILPRSGQASALEISEAALDRERDGKVSEAEVRLAGRAACAFLAEQDETNLDRANRLGESALGLPDDAPLPDERAALLAVTADDLARVGNAYLIPRRRVLGRHQPILSAERIIAAVGRAIQSRLVTWAATRARSAIG